MLLLTNEDVRQVLTMEKCLEAVEESTLRAGRGQVLKWDAGRLLEEKGSFGGSGSSYGLRLNPVFDLVDDWAYWSGLDGQYAAVGTCSGKRHPEGQCL